METAMYRPFVIAVTALALAAPIARSQSSTTERQRAEQERDRLQRERDQAQRDRDQAQRDREQALRDQSQAQRDADRARRDRQRELDREERRRAGSLDTTVTFDARGTLSVTCPGGTVIVTGSDRNEIRVRARTESGTIRFTSAASRAVLETAAGRCSDGRFEVSVPVGTRVIANSWSGSVSVRGVRGEVQAHVQSGDVEVRDATRLEIEALSGDIRVQEVRGDVGIRSISGDVRLSDVHGDVEVESVSGDVDLAQIVAKQVRAHTTSGEITFGGQIMDAGRYEFNTHSGELRLNLPPDFGAELSISTFNGAIESDFPITLKAGEHGIGASQSKRINFTVGRGSARIIAETFSGEITLSTKGRR
jgi:DUF4097 and DUF4098 domain-containing protein YvlB